MNTCAYCGGELSPNQFICASCSSPGEVMETAKPTPDPVVKTAEKTRIVEEDKVVAENQSTDLIKDEEPGPASSSVSIQEEIAAPEEVKIAGKKISPVKPEEPISSNSAQDKEHFEESIDKLLNNDQTEWI